MHSTTYDIHLQAHEDFRARLPYYGFAGPSLNELCYLERDQTLQHDWLQIFDEKIAGMIHLDHDDERTAFDFREDATLPTPNHLYPSRTRGHVNLVYVLDEPVFGERLRATWSHARESLTSIMGSDSRHTSPIVLNPFRREWFSIPRTTPWTLDELYEYVPTAAEQLEQPTTKKAAKLDRNAKGPRMRLFWLLRAALLADRLEWHPEDAAGWLRHAEATARNLVNQHQLGTKPYDVRSTVRSVSRWCWKNPPASKPYTRMSQSERGTRSGEVRRQRTASRDQQIADLRSQGLSQTAIAQQTGLTRQGVAKVLRRML